MAPHDVAFRLPSALMIWAMYLGLLTSGVFAQMADRNFTSTAPECPEQLPAGSRFITPDCTDPSFSMAIIDDEIDAATPVTHRLVSGHFNGTTTRFNIYLPPRNKWEGRFFQFVYPLVTEEAKDETIAFSLESGGYAVQITGSIGFRADAAAAKVARQVAAKYYKSGCRHIYGYIYGGSGGSLQTVGAIENSRGVWDGAVPMIQAVPVSFLNNPAIRALSGLVLKDKAAQIADAVRPGGGDPRENLTAMERAVFDEATMLGIPLGVWEVFDLVTDSAVLALFSDGVASHDPTYAQDFWNAPGYLGTEQSELGDLIRAQAVNHTARINSIERAGNQTIRLLLDSAPPTQPGLHFELHNDQGESSGALVGTLDGTTFTVEVDKNEDIFSLVNQNSTVQIDNLLFIAVHAYYRHQIPKRDGFYGFDQFKDATGQPIHPQRSVDGSLNAAESTSQGRFTGQIQGKMIAVNSLLDYDAFPWHADWYRSQVEGALGSRANDNYRLWFNEHADHTFAAGFDESLPAGARAARIVDTSPIVHQALRDLSAWVEQSIDPSPSTNYTVVDGQVLVAEAASQRFGVQPAVTLQVNGSDRYDVAAGTPVIFDMFAEVPPGTGKIIATEWDFMGRGEFTAVPLAPVNESVDASVHFVYEEPGTYFPAIKVTAHRDGDTEAVFGRVSNLGRCRIVVS
ncbi:hypothetical protein VD0002_g5677 [Verticillium dahliae]|uniref:PKD domain-containing protein n=1 Tax=Verticillium dahliae TaxID=27337 RepID=A0AA44WL70_VERDA|nr:hypothetical protein EV126DRAFT_464298 [Verticillium dahliae]KAH6704725.1 hypothetical protein EV126DRAFT_359026 [Verticillium dahliae]PNH33506.1 hypothetical protein BJF96_g3142 [Verticillium dahliae]PNH62366.1 hypothetical protein VD0002_g5677 [Verticillium dahliae]